VNEVWIDDLPLPAGPPVLALGAHFQAAVCVAGPRVARLSPPLVDLDSAQACDSLRAQALDGLRRLAGQAVAVQAIAHDAHPDFPSTALARQLAAERGVPAWAVQHHHAHLAAVWAEHAMPEPAPHLVGLALDGFGLGTDGQAWGGELLHLHGPRAHRLGHLSPLPLPGGDAASREPWRLAAAALHRLGRRDQALAHAVAHGPAGMAEPLLHLLDRGWRCPPSTSLGRLFDAAASLLGLCHRQTHPAAAAQALEAAALRHGPCPPLPGGWQRHRPANQPEQLDFGPLLAHLADATDPLAGAACFQATVAEGLALWLMGAAAQVGTGAVALGGGCLHNRLLRSALHDRLSRAGLRCLLPQRLPPGDAAIAYGQAVVARLVLAYH
jgi:hydrogenase maturation protein HypF